MIDKFNKSHLNKHGNRPFQPKKNIVNNGQCFCLINITRTKNNTHSTISNLFGVEKTKWAISAGQLSGSVRSKGGRKTKFSQRLVYKSTVEKALGLGYTSAVIHCKGDRGSKTRIYRAFSESLNVLLLKDTSGLAHNGCRGPKMRRI